jgi:hypothetical protein
MTNTPKLLPCPFDHIHLYGEPEIRELIKGYWIVQCLTARHAVHVTGETKEEVIELWNRRYIPEERKS